MSTTLFENLAKDIAATADKSMAAARTDICAFAEFVARDVDGRPIKLKPFHRQMLETMVTERLVQIEAFRNSGKSTIAAVLYPLWCLMHNRDLRIAIVTESDKLATHWLREIERYMGSDQYIQLAGKLIPSKGETPIWASHEKIVAGRSEAAQGASLVAIGVQGTVRGRRFDKIICDDICTENNSHTPYQREVLSNWFHGALLPTLDVSVQTDDSPELDDELKGQIVYLDTPLYDSDLSAELRKKWAA